MSATKHPSATPLSPPYVRFGGLHYGFNNAGAAQSVTPLVDLSMDEFERLMNVNVKGTFLGLKYMISCDPSVERRRDLQ